MPIATSARIRLAPWFCVALLVSLAAGAAIAQAPATSGSATVRVVGSVKSIQGGVITVAGDSGSDTVTRPVAETKILRTNPGEKDLTHAVAVSLSDLQPGDRVLVRGRLSEDAKSITPSTIVVLKKNDLSDLRQRQLQDWQKRGIGGLVHQVDAGVGTVTISRTTATGVKDVVVHISKNTVVRRYAPDSIKFDDAKPGTLADIRPGDQLRARGALSSDGLEMPAEEVVSGSFRNIAGTITAVDSVSHTITVTDLGTKKTGVVHFSPDSQLRKLPPAAAMIISMRLRGFPPSPPGPRTVGPLGGPAGGETGAARSRGFPPGGGIDLQQLLTRLPPMTPADLQTGDPVLIVATGGPHTTAITLLTGVQAILSVSPDGSQAASILSPWNLGAADAAGSQ